MHIDAFILYNSHSSEPVWAERCDIIEALYSSG